MKDTINAGYDPCQSTDCRNNGVVVVRDDALNGTRLCVECLIEEGENRDWWTAEGRSLHTGRDQGADDG